MDSSDEELLDEIIEEVMGDPSPDRKDGQPNDPVSSDRELPAGVDQAPTTDPSGNTEDGDWVLNYLYGSDEEENRALT